MSAPSVVVSRVAIARWVRRGGAALGSFALNAAIDSLELGKRAIAWLSHPSGARSFALATLAVVALSGAAWIRWQAGATSPPPPSAVSVEDVDQR